MPPHYTFRLKKLLLASLEREGSMVKLQDAINAAAHKKNAVNRRKLTRLLFTDDDAPLHISELAAFNAYLSKDGPGLASLPIFESLSVLAMLAAMKTVSLFVGVRSIDKNFVISLSDAEAYDDLARSLNRISPGVLIEQKIALMGAHQRDPGNPVAPWGRLMDDAPGVGVVASPLSNPATHTLLEKMLGPYPLPSKFGGQQRPPFAFVFPEEQANLACSAFVESPAHLGAEHARVATEIRDRSWGMRLQVRVKDRVKERIIVSKEEEHRDDTSRQLSRTFGVILAQRSAKGQVRVVVAGLHGAGTHAAALALEHAEIDLAAGSPGQDGPVHVRVVEAQVSTTSLNGTLLCRVVKQRILPEFMNTSLPPYTGGGPAPEQAA